MPIISKGKFVEVQTDDRRELQLAGRYWQSGYTAFLETGDKARLRPFKGKTVAGHPLETDPDKIEDFANANPGFDPGELYEP